MLKNYFKIAWRNLYKSKTSSFINIAGLSVGMAVAIIISLWIWDELSFNRYHKNYGQLVKVMDHQTWNGETNTNDVLPIPLGTSLRTTYGYDLRYVAMVRETEEHIIAAEEKKFTQAGNYMQPDAPEMFSLRMLYGTRDGLKDPHSILLSASLSRKLFGDRSPIDKVLTIDAEISAKVTGVFADLPNNSEFHTTTFIASFELWGADKNDWTNYNTYIYAQLNSSANPGQMSTKIRSMLTKNIPEEGGKHQLFFQPMSKWHLYSSFKSGMQVTSDQMKFIWFYGIIGVFVLILACINFMNLSTARSERRAREVGIRKAIGSSRAQLVQQFYAESFLIAILSFLFSLVLVYLTLPWFNSVAGKEMSILWTQPGFWLAGLGFTIITGLLSGSYPALYLSSFNPIKVLKGPFRSGKFASVPRRVLLVLQFTVSVALIIGTAVIYRQIQFAKNRPVGYSQSNLVSLAIKSPDFDKKYNALKNELTTAGTVAGIANANYAVTDTRGWNGGFHWGGKAAIDGQSFNTISVSQEYGETVGWQLVAGRDFHKERTTDSTSIILNESAVKLAGLKDPVGQLVKWEPGWGENRYFEIIGVARDMVKGSPFTATYPSVIFLGGGNWLFLKLNPQLGLHEALAKSEAAFKRVFPSLPFDYKFVDEEYGLKFAAEERIGKLAGVFAVLAIFISCMGLFGLATYTAEQRAKEIGIRKVLGASVLNVWQLLSKDFVALVILSGLIAIPLAQYFLHNWLMKYEYRTNLSWWIFGGAVGAALMITIITVSVQAIKAAFANPVKSLRTE